MELFRTLIRSLHVRSTDQGWVPGTGPSQSTGHGGLVPGFAFVLPFPFRFYSLSPPFFAIALPRFTANLVAAFKFSKNRRPGERHKQSERERHTHAHASTRKSKRIAVAASRDPRRPGDLTPYKSFPSVVRSVAWRSGVVGFPSTGPQESGARSAAAAGKQPGSSRAPRQQLFYADRCDRHEICMRCGESESTNQPNVRLSSTHTHTHT